MKREDLLNALGEIREEYILEADPGEVVRPFSEDEMPASHKMIPWKRYSRAFGTVAAAVVLIIGIGIFQRMNKNMKTEQSAVSMENTGVPKNAADGTTPEYAEEMTEAAEAEWDLDMASAVQESEDAMPADDRSSSLVICATLEEAEEISGFSLELPRSYSDNSFQNSYADTNEAVSEKGDTDNTYDSQEFSAIENAVIEVRYLNQNKEEGYRIRKQAGLASLDEETQTTDTERIVKSGDRRITLKESDTELSAFWEENGYSYTVVMQKPAFSEGQLLELIGGIR